MTIIKSDFSTIAIPTNRNFADWLIGGFEDCLHRVALVNAGTCREFTYGDVKKLVNHTCHILRKEYNFTRGETICFFIQNSPETAILMLSMFKLGLRVTGVNPLYTPDEFERQLRDSGASYVFTRPDILPKIRSSATKLKGVLVEGTAQGCISLTSILQDGIQSDAKYEIEHEINACCTTALLPYSSGTTGLPKGVEITHYNLIANVMQISHPDIQCGRLATPEGGRIVSFTPFFHVSGLVVGLFQALVMKAMFIIMPAFNYEEYFHLVEQYKPIGPLTIESVFSNSQMWGNFKMSKEECVPFASIVFLSEVFIQSSNNILDQTGPLFRTEFLYTRGENGAYTLPREDAITPKATAMILVPPILLRTTKDKNLHKYDLSGIRYLSVGAAPTPINVIEDAKRIFNLSDVTQGYGLSETTCVATMCPPTITNKPASVGKLLPNTEAKVISEDTGETLELMRTGELCIRGPQVMRGYWRKPQQTHNIMDKNGWLHTGDIAFIDEEGCVFIVDRLKELIKYKGFQVPPAELEAVLTSNRDVEDAAVVGVPHAQAGEVPRAFVVSRKGSNLTEVDVQKYVAGRVAPYKTLRGGVVFVQQIPKSPSGKILRRLLKSHAAMQQSKL